VQRVKSEGIVNVLGLQQLDDIITIPYRELRASQQVIWFCCHVCTMLQHLLLRQCQCFRAFAGFDERVEGIPPIPKRQSQPCHLLQPHLELEVHSGYR